MDTSKARKDSPHKEDKIQEIEHKARIAELLVDAGEHDGIRMLLDQMVARVDSINQRMCWDVKTVTHGAKQVQVSLSPEDRIELNARRGELMSIIETFPNAKARLDALAKKLKTYER